MKLSRRALLGSLPALSITAASEASAASNCGSTLLGTFPLEARGMVVIPVTLNGLGTRMVVDTGADSSTIARALAISMRLPETATRVTTLNGIGGSTKPRRNALIPELIVGGARFKRVVISVWDVPSIFGTDIAGLLGADLLLPLDMDFDFPSGRLSFYQSDNCIGEPVNWTHPVEPLPLESGGLKYMMAAELDGVALNAMIDTGAASTLLMPSGAAKLGLATDQLTEDPSGNLQGVGPNMPSYRRHRFRQLRLGSLRFDAPDVSVSSARMARSILLNPYDLVIGLSTMRQTRMWLSHRAGAVFFRRA